MQSLRDGNLRIPLLSVNVGLPRVIAVVRGEEILSGIAKHPVTGPAVIVRSTNIEGDGQADLSAHGGVDKAVYAYPAAHWPWWQSEKNFACAPASFGENLTVQDTDERDVHIGDRFSWGEVLLEVCQPRAPCFKLALHMGRQDGPQAMTLSGRCGWYMRVLAEGSAPVRDSLMRIRASAGPTVREAFLTVFSPQPDREALQRIHGTPALSTAWRAAVERKIAGLKG